jgi:hypothetical protein
MSAAATALVFHESAAETLSGNSGNLSFPPKEGVVTLDITAVAGTPTLDVTIEEFDEASGKWEVIHTIAQQSTVTKVRAVTTGAFGHIVRAVWAIGGTTPSFTFSLSMMGKVDR